MAVVLWPGTSSALGPCVDGTSVDLGSNLEGFTSIPGEAVCHDVYLPTEGWLVAEAVAEVGSSSPLRLDTAGLFQRHRLHRLAASTAVEVAEAGWIRLRVSPQDPRSPLGAYRLVTAFGAGGPAGTGREGDPGEDEPDPDPITDPCGTSREGDPGEDEPDPDPVTDPCGTSREGDPGEDEPDPDPVTDPCGTSREGDPGEDEPDPDPVTDPCGTSREGDPGEDEPDPDPISDPCGTSREGDPGEDEPDPDPITDPCGGSGAKAEARLRSVLPRICRHGRLGDAPDLARCADTVALGSGFRSTLDGFGGDLDHYRFEVRRLTTVELVSRGDLDTAAVLLDGLGHRLAADDDSGEAGNFRIVRTLPAGSYVLRVEGSMGAKGVYGLTMKPVSP
ncbi:MAG: hypothetical protein AAGN66_15440 [Acidobacteriota bacterium]